MAGAVTWDSSRVPGQRETARVPGAVREMNLALRRGPPVATAQTLFSPDAQNAIMGGTIQWRAQFPRIPRGRGPGTACGTMRSVEQMDTDWTAPDCQWNADGV